MSNEDISDDARGWTTVAKEDNEDLSNVPIEDASKDEKLSTPESNKENSGDKECVTPVSVSSGDS